MPGRSELPVVCNSLAQIYSQIECNGKAVVKSPWSSSGRGLLLFPNQDTKKKNDEVLSGMIKQQGFVTVEPWLEKVMDLSYQFFSAAGKINYKGRTFFETDAKGRYVKNVLTDNVDIQDDIRLFLQMNNSKVVDILLNLLSHSDYTRRYEGWIGVDAIIYRSADGALKFHPMVEINGRFTMGAIALKIREYLASGSNGFMQIYYSKTVNFKLFSEKKQVEKPLVMKDHKLVSGFLPLTPPLPDHHFGAYIEVDCSTNGHGGRSGAIR